MWAASYFCCSHAQDCCGGLESEERYIKLLYVFQCIFIVHVIITNVNRLFLISGIAVFVAAIFLIPNTPNTTMAYTCSSSSSTHNVKLQSSLTGSSGGCAVSSSAATTSGPNGSSSSTASGPNNTIGIGLGSNSLSVSSILLLHLIQVIL